MIDVGVYGATIIWNGEERGVQVLATGARPLLGTLLLDGFELNVQFIEGGAVSVESLSWVAADRDGLTLGMSGRGRAAGYVGMDEHLARHPHRGPIAAAIREGYTASFPSMGYTVERRPFGYYQWQAAGFGAVTADGLTPEAVETFLADAGAYYGGTPFGIYLDHPTLDAALGPALVAAGCAPGAAQVHLAHVGPRPAVRPVPGIAIEEMTDATVAEWCVTKLKGFADSEAAPEQEDVRFEASLRRAEAAGEGRFRFARAGSEAASIIGVYAAEDVTIFLLATRVPFRNRGIARWLLSQTLAEAAARGHRATTISCDPADTPIQLYRRLGFTDQVHWRRRYEPSPSLGSSSLVGGDETGAAR